MPLIPGKKGNRDAVGTPLGMPAMWFFDETILEIMHDMLPTGDVIPRYLKKRYAKRRHEVFSLSA